MILLRNTTTTRRMISKKAIPGYWILPYEGRFQNTQAAPNIPVSNKGQNTAQHIYEKIIYIENSIMYVFLTGHNFTKR